MDHTPATIVSGGQTGVDRGALDAAVYLGIPHGGWCPRGRLAEDGVIPPRYDLEETSSRSYAVRTERNVVDSDATLILYRDELAGGTLLTRNKAIEWGRPVFALQLPKDGAPPLGELIAWLAAGRFERLNIAGPRESQQPGIHRQTRDVLIRAFS